MRVLVTGGSGHVGSRVVRLLAARDDVREIVDVDVRPPPFTLPKLVFVRRSVTEDLRDLFRRTVPLDAALHLAWTVDALRDRARQREICIGGTRNFLAGCEAGEVKQLLFVSSAAAYGAHPDHAAPLDESAPLRAGRHFQCSAEKREAEGLFQEHARSHPGVLVQVARPALVAGPSASNFVLRSMERSPTLRPAGHDPMLQVVHEDDCAAALVAILRSGRPGAFNVAADGGVTVGEALRRLGSKALPVPLPAMYAAAWVAWTLRLRRFGGAPPGFVWFVAHPWLVSSRRLKEEVGFRFRYDAEETLAAYLGGRPR